VALPARNRIIAGLARATVVVEARERSGALITADFALEDGREVLACRARSPPASAQARTRCCGSERPLQRGAMDVLEALGLDPQRPATTIPDDPVAAAVLAAIESGAGTPDELSRATGVGCGRDRSGARAARAGRCVAVDEGVVRSTIAR
jgi:DNA processing protein